ncbi:maleylpyruvate isomerase family mycothiol-dependent enzyme [Dactylosporangium sp. CA-139066]|uniref:maleylpyruvate isomerase family mycothiol-dependent enzyme n=1 Tax=Dactylosporangium sp. CA-139066 TaxID=3239930 RepID=UPI003D90342A
MDAEESWRAIAAQRLALADLLEGLRDEEWERASLCQGWRVRDVAAHVAMAPQVAGVGALLADAVRARGSFHRLNHDAAVRHAEGRPAARLVDELRTHAHSRRLPAVTNYRNILFDTVVHGLDVAVPLHRPWPVPAAVATAAADRVWSMGWPFWARRRLRGVRLVATDADWSAGTGAEARGPIAALLLLLTGRTAAAAPRLSGPGAPPGPPAGPA